MKAFAPCRFGRKVIISTPVAETSLTIEDVVCVIDTGKVKETRYDAESNLSRLEEVWTSRASAKQRRGRAGRVREGEYVPFFVHHVKLTLLRRCWKLYSRWTEEQLSAHTLPEIQRTPLDQVVLSVKVSKTEDTDVRSYLQELISPPNLQTIDGAIGELVNLGAIEASSNQPVTPLGKILNNLPLDLKVAKLLVLGVIFSTLEPVLLIAAMLSSKPLFITAMEKREETRAARAIYETSNSDLLTNLKALQTALASEKDGKHALRTFCEAVSQF